MADSEQVLAMTGHYPDPTSRSAALYARALGVMPTGTTRGQTFFPPYLVYMDRAEGARIWDVDGVERIDFVNNYTVQLLGHSHPAVVRAVQDQAARAISAHMPTVGEVELAELLAERNPGFERVRFANTGSEAVMHAMKAARALTGRPKIAKCEGLYHGSYDVAEVSLDSDSQNWGQDRPASVPYSRGVPQGTLDDTIVIPFNDIEGTRAILRAQAATLAAVVVDLYPSRVGWVAADPAYVQMLRDVTREIGALLIIDEVVSFRTAYGGAQALYGVTADLTTLGKIIGGGLPIAAVAGSPEAMSVFETPEGRKALLPHSGTFTGNPLSAAAGIAAMRVYDAEAVAALDAMGRYCQDLLQQVFTATGVEGQVTRAHSLIGIYFSAEPFADYRTFQRARTPLAVARMDAVFRQLLNRGILFGNWGLGCLSTAMTRDECERFADALHASLTAMQAIPELQL